MKKFLHVSKEDKSKSKTKQAQRQPSLRVIVLLAWELNMKMREALRGKELRPSESL